MYLESIKFKRTKVSEWERGYYLGDTDNSDKSIIVDSNFKEVPKDETGCRTWNYCTDTANWIQYRCP